MARLAPANWQMGAILAGLCAGTGAAFAGDAPRLSLPIACDLGVSCFVQNYVDVDAGPGVKDYRCGSETYDGHGGVDFRLGSAVEAQKGIGVLASADGIIKGVRDGMADIFVSAATREGIKGRECGNGVVVEHGAGWETQYCHMRRGSILVKPGERVSRGQRLGEVGYSGLTEFAHLHLSVRHDGAAIDPFTGERSDSNATCFAEAASLPGELWDAAAGAALPYSTGEIIAVGFTAAAPELGRLELEPAPPAPERASEQLIFFARLINMRAGDRVLLHIEGPEGLTIESASPLLDRNKASYLAYTGKKRTSAAWPAGAFAATAELVRDDKVIARKEMRFAMPE